MRPAGDVLRETWERQHAALDLPPGDRIAWTVLGELSLGLHAACLVEDRWGVEWGRTFRKAAVIKAAQERPRVVGHTVTPAADMRLDEALSLLRAN